MVDFMAQVYYTLDKFYFLTNKTQFGTIWRFYLMKYHTYIHFNNFNKLIYRSTADRHPTIRTFENQQNGDW